MKDRYKDPEEVERLYWIEGLSQTEIADRYSCNPGSVSYFMRKENIPTRSGSEALHRKTITVSDHQHDIITGLLMSDGYCCSTEGSQYFGISMTNGKFIKWLKGKLEGITNSIRTRRGNHKIHKKQYRLRTFAHEKFKRYRNWYEPDKVWPEKLNLKPIILKMLFVGDGCLANRYGRGRPHIKICASKESNNKEKVEGYFREIGFSPSWNGPSIQFSADESKDVWEYMGSPPPGFRYKWPEGR